MITQLVKRSQRMLFPLIAGIEPIKFELLFPNTEEVDIKLQNWNIDLRAGNLWELITTAFLCRELKPKYCVEMGTGVGRSTLQMALNSPDDCQIHTFDLLDKPEIGSAFKEKNIEKINFHLQNTHDFDFSEIKGKVDYIFIDAGHEYDDVMKDSKLAFELLSDKGVILWDDFSVDWPGVMKACQEIGKTKKLYRILGTSYVIYLPNR